MAPLPKPEGATVRRNAGQRAWRTLPPAEDFKRPPPLPARSPTWLKATRAWWGVLWRSPMATTYLEADVEPLIRLAELVEARNRGELSSTGRLAMTTLEDRFGISPKARRALQWEIATAARADDGQPAAAPKLRVVDA